MQKNYTLSKIMHETQKIKVAPNAEKAVSRFRLIAYVIIAANVAAAIAAIAVIILLTLVIK